MEFIKFDEAAKALLEIGVYPIYPDEDHLRLEVDQEKTTGDIYHMHLRDEASTISPREGAKVVSLPKAQLASAIDSMVGQLHLSQLLVYPVGKWRSVFDAVAFSLATNEDWQAIDAMATVELNTRDPLLCEPGDYQLLNTLINALLEDAETPDQGIIITNSSTPFIAEIAPEGVLQITVGNQVLADEIADGLRI